ncbi:MAG: L-seryl-tRNA(Sec) selenium transferase [Gaiellales bacterium]|nr:L-seryl-tRNA(Sec) selenium transferase [Gaiellales bacterium]
MDEQKRDQLRRLPSVEELMRAAGGAGLLVAYPRSAVVAACRDVVAEMRTRILTEDAAGHEAGPLDLMTLVDERVRERRQTHLKRLINAGGVIVNTNLGRSALAPEAVAAATEAATHYSNLEYRLETGERGSRHEHVESLLVELTGAEAAMVVNNNAAAVLLMLTVLAAGQEVVVSRGQLVEIGGSFRIPDILRLSGARLVEVGTTNKTRLSDYADAITTETALLLRVHTSNFKVVGFAEEVPIDELARLGEARRIPVADDVGSGALANIAAVAEEPSVTASVRCGADVVTFSGDKLLGGPQAGLIVGRRIWVEAMKRHPLARAVRVDKMTLAALEATLLLYREPERAISTVPTLRLLSRDEQDSREMAERLAEAICRRLRENGALDTVEVGTQKADALPGGGALPLWSIASWEVTLKAVGGAAHLETALRLAPVPVVSRVTRDRVHLVMAALEPEELELLADSVAWAVAHVAGDEG